MAETDSAPTRAGNQSLPSGPAAMLPTGWASPVPNSVTTPKGEIEPTAGAFISVNHMSPPG